MIKINLLPPNIYEARTIKRLVALFAVILVLIVFAGVSYTAKLKKDTEAKKAEADMAESLTKQAQQYESQAQSIRSGIAPIQQKVEFFKAVQSYNEQYPKLYEELTKFTYAKVIYSQLTPSGSALQIQAFAPSLSDVGRYLLNLYKATHVFTSVAISAVPGYPQEGGQAGSGQPGMGMPPPPPGLMTGGTMGLPPMPGGLPGSSPQAMPSTGGTGYGGLEAITSGVTRAAERRKGFSFTVTCTLKTPITPPAPPGGGGGVNAQGMGGGMPGMGAPMPGTAPTPPGAPGGPPPGA